MPSVNYWPYERGSGRPASDEECPYAYQEGGLAQWVFVPPMWEPKLSADGRWPAHCPIKRGTRA